ncbi:MAG: hybrid sensor histidine kinase/response regulator [Candidatus Binatia bacterium]
MKSTGTPMTMEQQLREMNEALLISSVRQHELTEQAQKAEAALRESNARFEALFDASPVGMYLVDADLRIRLTSRTARPVFGDIGELIGRDFVEVIHILWPAESADEIVARFRHTLETGEPHIALEFSEERYDRKVRECYDWQIHRINLPDGQYGVVCYFIDVSKRVQLSDDLRQYAANMFDADRRKNEFLAMLAHELRNPLAPISNALQIMRLAPGDEQSVQAATEMMERQVGEMVRLVDDLLDVSRISRGTIELRRGRVELASVVRHAVEASRPAMESAEQALTITLPPQPIYLNADPTRLAQVLGNLLNNANKFTDKGGRIELVVSVEWQVVSEEKKGEFRDDRAALSRAQSMTSGDEPGRAVLPRDEALPQGGTVRPDQPDSTSSSIDTGQHRRGPGAAAHKGIPEPSENPAGIAHGGGNPLTTKSAGGLAHSNDTGLAPEDVGRSQSNALGASAGAGSEALKLATQHSPIATPFAVIRVRDNGIGIAAGELPHVFDMFTQVDTSLKRSIGGLGIGLTVVKNLVEMHAGTVSVHSAGVGQGSEFVVRLPVIETLETAQPPPPQPTVSAPTTMTPCRILVVDDNRLSADSLARLLYLTGNETHTAYDGLEAVEAALTFRADVVLLDIGLPKLNGYEAARKIREQPWGKNIVIVALTGWGQDEDRRKSKAAGFNGHMVKPVDLTALMKLLVELQPTVGTSS